jgi:maltose-binding protein MalE
MGFEFYQILKTLGGEAFDSMSPGGYHPQFNTDIGHEAMDILTRLMAYRHPVTLNAADDEANQALANGTAVFAPFEWGTSILTDSEYTEFADVFGTEIVPKGTRPGSDNKPLMGGFAYYVNTSGEDQAAAFEWIKHVNSADYTDTRIGEAFCTNTGQPTRLSLLDKYATHQPYFSGLKKSFAKGTPGLPWIPENFACFDLVGNEATAVVVGEKNQDEALKAMDEGVTQIMSDGGYYG